MYTSMPFRCHIPNYPPQLPQPPLRVNSKSSRNRDIGEVWDTVDVMWVCGGVWLMGLNVGGV